MDHQLVDESLNYASPRASQGKHQGLMFDDVGQVGVLGKECNPGVAVGTNEPHRDRRAGRRLLMFKEDKLTMPCASQSPPSSSMPDFSVVSAMLADRLCTTVNKCC